MYAATEGQITSTLTPFSRAQSSADLASSDASPWPRNCGGTSL
jgi:hypothetical protein